MRNIFLLVLFYIFVLTQPACKKRKLPDVAEDYILDRSLFFYVIDSVTNQSLIGKNGEKYHPDSIKVVAKRADSDKIGVIAIDSSGKYKGGILYLITIIPGPEYILPLKLGTEVMVYLNKYETDTFFIDKQPGQGFAYYLNKKHLVTIAALDRASPTFYIKK